MKLMTTGLVGLVAVGTIGLGQATEVKAEEQSTTSQGSVTFKLPETNPEIIIPEGETEEIIDPEEGGPSSNGPLRIDFASNINFGVQEISATDKTYNALLNNYTTASGDAYVSTFAQITDNRGTNGGWELSLAATEFTIAGTSSTIENAQLKIVDVPNVTNDFGYHTDTNPVGKATGNIIGGEAPIATAQINQGMGQWHVTLGETGKKSELSENKAIQLEVPGRSQTLPGATYTSTLTWTLSDSI